MKKVILFGSTGNLGTKVAERLNEQGYSVTAVVRNKEKAAKLKPFANHFIVADVTEPSSLNGICRGFEVVISTLGKSVSPNNRSKPSFRDIDLVANSTILNDAVKNQVKKFVYVSALHAERLQHLEYFAVHHQFSEALKQSEIDYSIIKPPALFSAFVDLFPMAQKGVLFTMGKGDKLTNPIYEGDLANVVVDSIHQSNAVIEAGGNEVVSRKEINEIIQRVVAPHKTVRQLPLWLIKMALPLIKPASKNLYHKMEFFTAVMEDDAIAPRMGKMRLEDYVRMKMRSDVSSFQD